MKAMLACSTIPELKDIKYPVLASPKLDGIRCLIVDGIAVSRTLKPIPNRHIQETLAKYDLEGLDGELMVEGDFNSVQSAVMSIEGKPRFSYWVFDWIGEPTFKRRQEIAEDIVERAKFSPAMMVRHVTLACPSALKEYWEQCLLADYEGAIVRDPHGPYKFGRSTMKQGWMLKLKKFDDDEGIIIGCHELMRNEDTSSKKLENMVPAGMLGSFEVDWNGVIVDVGTGFTEAQRIALWLRRKELLGAKLTFKYQGVSRKGVPRFPVYKTIRKDLV